MQLITLCKSLRAGTAGLFLFGSTLAHVNAADDLQPIFNGTNLAGWKALEPNQFWKIADGVLTGENNDKLTGNVLFTADTYTNFVIELDARWNGEIDSGVMLRAPELQVQFGISRSLKRDMTGAFYLAKTAKQPKPGYPDAGHTKGVESLFKKGDWNTFRIEAKGDIFTVWLNGEQVSQYEDAHYSGGAPIGLQIHPGLKMKVEYRHIRVKRLD